MQGLVKPPGERSTISATHIGMNFRALSSAVSTVQEGSHLCADSCPAPWGRKPAHGHYAGVGHCSQHGLGYCRSRDPGGQEKADKDHQGEGNSGSSAEGRSRATPGVRQRRVH
jgi:hypothetical protein